MKPHLLERLKMDRLHVAPRTLDLSPVHLRERFPNIWAPLEELARRLRPLPAGLMRYWLAQRGGHAIIVHHPSRYEVGEQPFGSQSLHNVAFVSLSDLASDSIEALVVVGNLLDHLLGSGGRRARGSPVGEAPTRLCTRLGRALPSTFHSATALTRWLAPIRTPTLLARWPSISTTAAHSMRQIR